MITGSGPLEDYCVEGKGIFKETAKIGLKSGV